MIRVFVDLAEIIIKLNTMINFILILVNSVVAGNIFTPETLSFKVTVDVDYRCYGGYKKEKKVDPLTKEICDNKNYKKTLFNKTIKITINSETTPDGPQYVGDWIDKQSFKGRNFEYAITIFKEFPKNEKPYYTLRATLSDSEQNRGTATTLKAFSPKEFNPITIDRHSVGPEISAVMSIVAEP